MTRAGARGTRWQHPTDRGAHTATDPTGSPRDRPGTVRQPAGPTRSSRPRPACGLRCADLFSIQRRGARSDLLARSRARDLPKFGISRRNKISLRERDQESMLSILPRADPDPPVLRTTDIFYLPVSDSYPPASQPFHRRPQFRWHRTCSAILKTILRKSGSRCPPSSTEVHRTRSASVS